MSKRVETRLTALEAVAEEVVFPARLEEVEAWFRGCQEKYNSPEEVQKRECWHKQLLIDGSKRKRGTIQ